MREEARQRASNSRRRAKGEGTVFRTTVRGEKVWRAVKTVHLPDDVVKRVTGTSPSRDEAIRLRDRKIDKLRSDAGELPKSVLLTEEERGVTLGEYIATWAENQDTTRLSANARERNRGLISNHITPHLGAKRLTHITTADVVKLFDVTLPAKKKKDGTPLLGGSPLQGIFYILRKVFLQAEAAGLIQESPMKYLTVPEKKKREHNLTGKLDDLLKLMNFMQDKQDGTFDYWVMTFYGLRQSERLGLQWSSFTNLWTDLNKPAYLHINRQLYNDDEANTMYVKMDTKTEAGKRVLPLPDMVRKSLIAQKRRQLEMEKSPQWNQLPKFKGMVYTTSTGNPVRASRDNERWRELVAAAGIDPLRGHDMRHLTASWLAETNVPVEVVKALIGHSTEAMTSYYTHISNSRKSDALTQLSAAYERGAASIRAGVAAKNRLTLIKASDAQGLPPEVNTLSNNSKIVEQHERNKQEK